MSAWIVSKEHIDVMVKAALEGPSDNEGNMLYLNGTRWDDFYWYVDNEKRPLTAANADEIGDMLVRENVRSVNHRYSYAGRIPYYGEEGATELEERGDDELPGPIDKYWVESYHYTDPGFRPTVAEIVKTIGCFEYQSCEHDEWKNSEAFIFCRELREAALAVMPGKAEAPWGWEAEDIARRRNA